MTFVTRRDFLPLTAAPLTAAAPGQRPNILFLMCDQLNPAVTSLYGGPVPTPNLEKLAARGVTFTHATCPTPFCSPTRASIVTGQYPHRHGIVHNVSKGDYPAIPAGITSYPHSRPLTAKGKCVLGMQHGGCTRHSGAILRRR